MNYLTFFTENTITANALIGRYDPVLVLLSYLIPTLASYTALSLVDSIHIGQRTVSRYGWFSVGSITLGIGIWAMHFIGMIAFKLPIQVTYDPLISFSSVIPAILASAIALNVIVRSDITRIQLFIGGVFMALGIGAMHYIGMSSMRLDAVMLYDPMIFVFSLIVAVMLALLALNIKFLSVKFSIAHNKFTLKIISALLMGLAVAGMHYSAMQSVYFFANGDLEYSMSGLSPGLLAVLVAVATLLIIALFLLAIFTHVQLTAKKSLSIEINKRNEAEESLQQLHRELEQRIKNRTAELSESEDRFRTAFETIAEGLITINELGLIETFNPAAERIFGYRNAEVIGKNVSLLMPEPFHAQHDMYLSNYKESSRSKIIGIERETEGRRKDGNIFPLYLSVEQTMVDGKRIFAGLVHDITERKRGEKTLSQFKTTLDILQDAVFIFKPDTLRFLYVNQGALNQVGYTEQALFNMAPFDIKPDFDEIRFREMVEPLISGSDHTLRFRSVHQHKNGSCIPVEVYLQYLSPANEEPRFVSIARDITERLQVEQEIKDRESRLDFLLTATPVSIYTCKASGDYRATFVSDNVSACFGYESSMFLKDPSFWASHIHPDDAPRVFEDLALLHEHGHHTHQYRFKLANGNYCWVYDDLKLIYDDQGQPSEIIGSWSRIDDLKAVETNLRRMAKVFLDGSDPVVIVDLKGLIIDLNREAEKAYGWLHEELLGKSIKILQGNGVHQLAGETLARCLRGEDVRNVEGVRLTKSGKEIPVLITLSLLSNDAGQAEGIATFAKDITESKRYNELLSIINHAQTEFIREPNAQLVFNSLLESLLKLTDSEYGFIGEVLYTDEGNPYLKTYAVTNIAWNEETQTFYENNVSQGMEFRNLNSLFGNVLSTGQVVISNTPAEDSRAGGLPEGHPPLDAFLGVPLYVGKSLVGMVGIANRPDEYNQKLVDFLRPFLGICASLIEAVRNEITRKKMEHDLAGAKVLAEQSTQAKSDFLANMSHEIRTPMNGVLGMLQLLSNTNMENKQNEYLGIARASANSLLTIINDILDFSKIEAGDFTLKQTGFDLFETVEDAVISLAKSANSKGIELSCFIDPDAANYVSGDAIRLRQVLVNLIGNGIKFTEQGEVNVRVILASQNENQICLQFEVSDTGIGIDLEKQSGLFKPFTQADTSTTRQFGGTGLGLAISRQLVEAMGGKIHITSSSKQGTTICFSICFNRSVQQTNSLIPSLPDNTRLLIVDNNTANGLVLSQYFSHWHFNFSRVDSAEAGLEKLK